MKSLLFRTLIVVSLLGLVACQSAPQDSKTTNQKPAVSKRQSRLLITPANAVDLGYSIAWSKELRVDPWNVVSAIGVADNMILTVESPRNIVTAFSAKSGEKLWVTKIDRSQTIFEPTVFGNKVLVNTESSVFLLSKNSGNIIDIIDLPYTVSTGATVIEGLAIFGGSNGMIFAMDLEANTPMVSWRYMLNSGEITVPLQKMDFSILAASAGGIYGKISGSEGKLIWKEYAFDSITATPAFDDMSIYVASEDQTLYCLDQNSGKEKWKYAFGTPLTFAPKALGLQVYQSVEGQGMHAFDVMTGKKKWQTKKDMIPVTGDDQTVVCATPRGLCVVDAKTGDILRNVKAGQFRAIRTLGSGKDLLLVSPKGQVVRINAR